MLKTLLCLLFLCCVFASKTQQQLPAFNYVPQPPVTAAFTKYGDVPVDLSTGLTSINIPIYTMNENGINVPISISYHASGIKVTDVASPIGLGWTLFAGGGLTRTILGKRDEYFDFGTVQRHPWVTVDQFLAANQAGESTDPQNWYYGLYHNEFSGYWDFHSDRFYYNLGNGESGVFRRKLGTSEFKTIPYKPIKVRFILPTPSSNLKIEITATDGIRYIFNNDMSMYSDYWNLEKIINSSNTDSVVIYSHTGDVRTYGYTNYQEFGSYKNTPLAKTDPEIVRHPSGDCWNYMYVKENDVHRSVMYKPSMEYDKVTIFDSIISTNTSIKFTYAQDRQETSYLFAGNGGNRLTNIQVYNKQSNLLIKNINFSHSYLGAGDNNKRLLLAGVQTGANGEEKHEFKYNPEPLPEYHNSMQNPVYPQDLWGYYNGVYNTSLLFADFAPGGTNGLFPNEKLAQAGILQEIKYPTGGKTVFEYESNRVSSGFYGPGFSTANIPADGKVGGLRIKKISSFAYQGAIPQVKSYEYVCDMDPGYGRLAYDNFAYNQECFNYYNPYVNGCGLVWREYGDYSRKNICHSSPMGRYIGSPQAPVYYNVVTEFIGVPDKNLGKTIYYYERADSRNNADMSIEPRFRGAWQWDIGSYLPPLLKKEEYKIENGMYKLVRKTETTYGGVHGGEQFITGLNLATDLDFVDLSPAPTATGGFDNYIFNRVVSPVGYFFSTIHYSNDWADPVVVLPEKNTVFDYVDNNNFVKTYTEYTYNQYGQQITANTTTSKGYALKTKITYPVDYPAQAPYNTMIERNILSPVIEQSTYKNTTDPQNLLQSMKTNYNYWDYANKTWGNAVTNQILPQTVQTKKGANDAENRIQYYSYDQKNNPVYVSKENDTRQLYIWSYNKAYPVAQVMNVAEEQKQIVSYTSFEDTDFGNWSFSGPKLITEDNTVPTGKRCLRLTNSVIISQNLNAGSSYILSYWYKPGGAISVNANATILETAQPKNGWIYVKRRITGSSSVSIGGSFSYIDELRLYPEAAQMTTFAYEPLVGITAQCDPNDRITYYTYDASNRLSLVKDDKGNILKKICYNFQGQPDACGENALAKWQLTGAMRCKPCDQSPGHFSNITQVEERDNNVNSESYGSSRWRDSGVISGPGGCAVGDWQLTGNLRCKTIGGQNTGEQEREWKDMNPCSPNSGESGWENIGMNTAACPKPTIYQSLDVSGDYYKQGCSSTQVTFPYYVNMPKGAYTSSSSVKDATNLALQAAQQLANQNAQCVTVYVKSVMVPKSNGDNSYQFGDVYFYFYSDAAGTVPLTLPVDVTINFSVHTWWVNNGTVSEQGTQDDWHSTGKSNSNYAVEYDFETSYCVGTAICRYQEVILLPGDYVIIP